MAYKLMAVDIDGTLLDSRGRITEETRKAVRMGVERGLIFTISSGRPVQGIRPLIRELDIDLPVITYNGAMVITGKSGEILYERRMPPENARRVIELGNEYGTAVMVWADNRLFANKLNDRAYKYSGNSGVNPEPIDSVDDVVKNGVSKVLWYDDADLIEKYKKEVGRYLSEDITYHTSRPIYLEFVDKNASKAIAMQKLGERYGIKRKEMIAVGDGFNDLSMIEYAGLGVAMGNALEVKEAIDVLKGRGPTDLRELCLVLGAHMLVLAGAASDIDAGKGVMLNVLEDGSALRKFKEMVENQGGDPAVADDCSLFPRATYLREVKAASDGFVQAIEAQEIGLAAMALGAGRETKNDEVDPAAGVVLCKKTGDGVKTGETLAVLHTNRQSALQEAEERVLNAYFIGNERPEPLPLVIETVM